MIGHPGRRDALVVHLAIRNWLTKADPRAGAKTSDSRTTSRPGTDICQFLITVIETNDQQLTNRNVSHLNADLPSRRIFLDGNTHILGHLQASLWGNRYLLGLPHSYESQELAVSHLSLSEGYRHDHREQISL